MREFSLLAKYLHNAAFSLGVHFFEGAVHKSHVKRGPGGVLHCLGAIMEAQSSQSSVNGVNILNVSVLSSS